MKGLLIKDIKLTLMQKSYFGIVFVIMLASFIFSNDASLGLGFMPLIMTLFTLSTISYDEFDNGNSFLFTLPIQRKEYVVEKYCFGLLMGSIALLIALVCAGVIGSMQETLFIKELLMTAFVIALLMVVMLSIMLPFQLCFGPEKARIALLAGIGIVSVLGVLVVKGASSLFGVDSIDLLSSLSTIKAGVLMCAAVIVAIVCLFISVKISVRIIKRKEF
ncbi:ABC-2 transporter permease [Amedibacillus dolichus]|uniref:ABC-2 transporter permease n=1 Tax=Amedibacillus dolichus TaxID=31971 RepID=UPI0039A0F128